MKKLKPIDLKKIKTYSAKKRKTKVELEALAKPASRGISFKTFYQSLPDFLAAKSLKEVVKAIIAAKKNNRPIVFAMGAHVIKVGLTPLIIDLMRKGLIDCVVLNGAGAIHDFELATLGNTSEDVAEGLETGLFGMVEETLSDMNKAITGNNGLGESLGEKILAIKAPHREQSILANARKANIPVTVHVAIGTDTIHMSPHVDPKALGQATYNDFHLLCSVISELEGGVYLNIGSAVLLPEVFLKALTVARNLGREVKNFTTANFDMIQHYRPRQNILARPGGSAYGITGHHEIMIPLLYQALLESL